MLRWAASRPPLKNAVVTIALRRSLSLGAYCADPGAGAAKKSKNPYIAFCIIITPDGPDDRRLRGTFSASRIFRSTPHPRPHPHPARTHVLPNVCSPGWAGTPQRPNGCSPAGRRTFVLCERMFSRTNVRAGSDARLGAPERLFCGRGRTSVLSNGRSAEGSKAKPPPNVCSFGRQGVERLFVRTHVRFPGALLNERNL